MLPEIAVLEWICGGGVDFSDAVAARPTELACLLAEGAAMLTTLASGLTAAEMKVSVAVSENCREFVFSSLSPGVNRRLISQTSAAEPLQAWRKIADEHSLTIVIAPECEAILERAIAALADSKSVLINCDQELIRTAGDKGLMAERFAAQNIPHPATRRLDEIDSRWIDEHEIATNRGNTTPRWIIKPAMGAGCEGIEIIGRAELMARRDARVSTAAPERDEVPAASSADCEFIVQPLLSAFGSGENYSLNVWIDRHGGWHFLPLTRQSIRSSPVTFGPNLSGTVAVEEAADKVADKVSEQTTLKLRYAGGSVLGSIPVNEPLCSLARRSVAACGGTPGGWIGLDLLYCHESNRWVVVEINPRFTTAIVGFAQSYTGDFCGDLMKLYHGQLDTWASEFRDMTFDVTGQHSH